MLKMNLHYARRRLKYTEILQHDVSKTGRGSPDFIFHIHRMNTIELSSPIMLLNHGRYDIGVAELADDYICVAIYAAGFTLSILLD